MSVLNLPTCPDDCAGSLPEVSFNECAPEVYFGEIAKIYVAKSDSADFLNVEDLAEWTTRLSQDSADADAIRELTVIAELPEPEVTEQTISSDRTIVGYRQFVINGEIDENNDVNYNFMLNLQCNLKHKIWYETADGILYGGNEGIQATIRAHEFIPRARTDVKKIMFNIKWKSKFSPLRCVSPNA